MSELIDAIRASSERLGVSPVDLATAISYETAATFDPWKKGPTTQWGEHRGLIQWGEPQRKKYGVTQDMSVADQMRAAERYLTDAGVKPGAGLLDIYSAINAGRVGLYNRSDANNGGAPGTVADKVATMGAHRMRAEALLGGTAAAPPASPPMAAVAAAPVAAAPLSLAPPTGLGPETGGAASDVLAALAAIPKIANEAAPMAAPPTLSPMPQIRMPSMADPVAIRYPIPPAIARARAMAQAAARRVT